MIVLILIWIAVAIYVYCRQEYSEFKRAGIKHFPPLPLVGNMTRILLKRDHFVDAVEQIYFSFPNERFAGRYEFMNKMIYIRDLELVKKIAVKDFDHFLDHRTMIDEKSDPLFGRNLFSMKGQEWKDMRSTLSPAFTSSKIRLMVPFMVDVGDQMMKALKNKIEDSNEGFIDVDVKDLTTRFANDVIASCAFGLKVDSHRDVDNEFYAKGKDASTFSFKQLLLMMGFMSFPKIMKVLKVTLFSKESQGFFRTLVMSTMKDREERNIIRPDMIHLLMEAKKGRLSHDEKATKDADAGFATVEESTVGKKDINRAWSDDDLTAQAILFFIAGFDTVSSAMSLLLHELALNADVQQRLAAEIRDHAANSGGKLDFNSIQSMVYMDMVVSESLRLWPAAVALDRICIKDYNLGKPNSEATEDYIIKKGNAVGIPVWGFHHDPQYFPEPQKFDPERFSDENKHKINPFAYMPFGVGPRNCIESQGFFRTLVMSTMKDREERNIIRPDMIHLLMEAKKGRLSHDEKATKDADAGFATVEESTVGKKDINRAWSDDDLTAQAILFFIAGFDTVSSAMSLLLHELALNADVQQRLAAEIRDHAANSGGKLDFNSIQSMVYMDMVVSESLRLWPAAVALDRICIKDYNLGKPNSEATEDYIIKKGNAVGIPVWGFHHDPQYFPEPQKFDPERFSDENKHKINPFAYMPFGVGPRNCIGSRLALCEVKVMVYQLLQHMELSPCAKTCIPSRLAKDTFQLKLEGGHWLRFTPRH